MFLLAFWALESLSQNQKANGTILSHVLKLSKFLRSRNTTEINILEQRDTTQNEFERQNLIRNKKEFCL